MYAINWLCIMLVSQRNERLDFFYELFRSVSWMEVPQDRLDPYLSLRQRLIFSGIVPLHRCLGES